MPLVYLPYMPSCYENFLLEGRNIRADVHEWLARRLAKGSRLQQGRERAGRPRP
jgi:hypothetical protein